MKLFIFWCKIFAITASFIMFTSGLFLTMNSAFDGNVINTFVGSIMICAGMATTFTIVKTITDEN